MLRNFGISLLLFGLLAAGIDGFRLRDRAVRAPESGTATELQDDRVHSAEAGIFPPK